MPPFCSTFEPLVEFGACKKVYNTYAMHEWESEKLYQIYATAVATYKRAATTTASESKYIAIDVVKQQSSKRFSS